MGQRPSNVTPVAALVAVLLLAPGSKAHAGDDLSVRDVQLHVLLEVQAWMAESSDVFVHNQLRLIITNLNDALDPSRWIDGNHPVPGHVGLRVFLETAQAVRGLQTLADHRDDLRAEAEERARQLAEEMRRLADRAAQEGDFFGTILAFLGLQMDRGDRQSDAGHPERAIVHYANAWRAVVDCVRC